MNLDAKIFIENDAQLKALLPTTCAITRKMRAEALRPMIQYPDDGAQLKMVKRREMCKSNLMDLVDDLINVREVLDGREPPAAPQPEPEAA